MWPGKQGKWHILPLHRDLCGNHTFTAFPSYTGSFHEQINTIKASSFQLLLRVLFPPVQQDPKPPLQPHFNKFHNNQSCSGSSKAYGSEWLTVLFWWTGFAPGLFQNKKEPGGLPTPDTNQLESNHYIICQPIQINVTLYQTIFYECKPFSSSIHTLWKVGVSTCKIKAFQCFLTKRVCDDRTFVMLEPVASLSRTHSIHIRDYQSLVSVKQTLVHSQRGKKPKAVSKKLSGNKDNQSAPKTSQHDIWGQSCTFPIPLHNPVTWPPLWGKQKKIKLCKLFIQIYYQMWLI